MDCSDTKPGDGRARSDHVQSRCTAQPKVITGIEGSTSIQAAKDLIREPQRARAQESSDIEVTDANEQ
ncbi:hypothetical protein QRN89_09945 [Streptomyces chengbuensis]|uniref:hypothetical protein n=1 Tax=Streptomyces chengbuensis TaxID=3053466 RepID=UPI0025B5E73C|nr:hypothetical protein [Streptomyces sp. HUAS CB01]WJY50113.1 hypothetical protein QRN89_09945 [Streptomyces sp. HUAS CB01]